MVFNKWSEKVALKLIRAQFEPITKRHWLITWFMSLIDSKVGKREWLRKWTGKQLTEYRSNKKSKTWLLSQKLKSNRSAPETVYRVEKYVNDNFRYIKDKGENWQTAEETIIRKAGDCEDQNNLIIILCLLAGVPNYMIYNVIGDSAVGYHYYGIFYYLPKRHFVALDSTAWADVRPIKDQPEWTLSYKQYRSIDFVWNEEHTFKLK